jgi:arabinan endo-1,5-alpha-L-arabinosidase
VSHLRLHGALVAVVATALVATATTAPAATVPDGDGVSVLASLSTFPLADPDTVLAKDGSYVTYGTTVGAGSGARCGATGRLYVPVLVHGSGSSVGMANCASYDALPSGPGAWAEPGGAIWAPGVARLGDRFFMFYTASRKGSGQKCIGRAVATSARGPFQNQGEWACPDGGRWALDANPFVSGGTLYVTYRDDAIATGAETGISTVRTDGEGRAIWDTRRDLLKSTDITWDTAKISGGTHVIENPAMWKAGDGDWYLMYSGNNWDSPRYATGIANCGTTPLPGSRCTPIRDGVARPFFGFTGATGLNPIRGLPGNHEGPGGMDVFTAADGTYRVVWHWWNGATRFPMTGVLTRPSTGFLVS